MNSPSLPRYESTCPGWVVANSYTVTVSNSIFGASGLGTVTVPSLHNSPAKPQTLSGRAEWSQCNFTITKKETQGKQVRITIKNNGSVDEAISALNLTWPAANGKLQKVKLDGDVVYDKPDIAGPDGQPDHRPARRGHEETNDQERQDAEVLIFEFEKNADANLSHYTGTVLFGPNCTLTVLP